MATVSFLTPDGSERSWELDASRPIRIGRDPDNEIVLRDPRVSRHHARIVHERGFFVLYDLASANGTLVNGRRIQVAPLVDGAKVRMGTTVGTFRASSEHDAQATILAADLGSAPVDAVTDPEMEPEGEPATTNPYPLAAADGQQAEASAVDPGGAPVRYVIALGDGTRPPAVRNGEDKPVLFFDPPPRLVGWIGGVVATMVAATGLTATIVLGLQGRLAPAALAVALTIAFVLLILFLIPPKEIFFCRDAELREVDLIVRQDNRIPVRTTEYVTTDSLGRLLAVFRKNRWSNVGRRRWWIVNAQSMIVGWAEEDSLGRALARKVAGHAVRALRSNYRFVFEGKFAGRMERREGEHVLELHEPFDKRIAIPLSVLIVATERQ
ncbi:MAG: FHA domain-containing protein [Thermoanaerobaculia bacterium]